MKVEKYNALRAIIPAKYKVKLRFKDNKVNLDVIGPKGNMLKPIVKKGYSKTTFFNLYGYNKDNWHTSKYELLCFMAGVEVIGVDEISTEFVKAHMDEIKALIRRELKKDEMARI